LPPCFGKDFKETFHTTVTAHDFVFGLRRVLLPQTASPYASALFMIKNAQAVHAGSLPPEQLAVEAVDNFTLRITLATASTDFLNILASPVGMPCNEEFFEATKGKYGLGFNYLLCNGPFYLSAWRQGTSIILRRNDEYAGSTTVVPRSVSFRVNPDRDKYAQNIAQGVYSAAHLPVQSASALEATGGVSLNEYENITWALCFNHSDSALRSSAVRIGLCKAIDRNALGPALLTKTKTVSLIPACCTVGQTPLRNLIKDVDMFHFDLTGAKKNWDNGLETLGVKEKALTILCPPEFETDMRGLMQTWQKTFGISLSVSVEVVEMVELQSRVSNGKYQIALAPIKANKSAAADFLHAFGSGSKENIFNYSSPDYDSLLNQIRTAGNPRQSAGLCELAQNHLLQNAVVYPLFSQSSYFALAKGVSGIYTSPAGEYVYFINGIAID
jgi:oligopeptide transport system substrate-binding protein